MTKPILDYELAKLLKKKSTQKTREATGLKPTPDLRILKTSRSLNPNLIDLFCRTLEG